MRYALLLLLLVPFAVQADCLNGNWMNCPADSSVQINSFAIQASYVIQDITKARSSATRRLKLKKISAEQAQVVLAKTDHSRVLWNQALAICKANRDGNCDNTADWAAAEQLLAKARGALK